MQVLNNVKQLQCTYRECTIQSKLDWPDSLFSGRERSVIPVLTVRRLRLPVSVGLHVGPPICQFCCGGGICEWGTVSGIGCPVQTDRLLIWLCIVHTADADAPAAAAACAVWNGYYVTRLVHAAAHSILHSSPLHSEVSALCHLWLSAAAALAERNDMVDNSKIGGRSFISFCLWGLYIISLLHRSEPIPKEISTISKSVLR